MDESDINFLTKIGKEHDAIGTVRGEALLFTGKCAAGDFSGGFTTSIKTEKPKE